MMEVFNIFKNKRAFVKGGGWNESEMEDLFKGSMEVI